MRRFPPFPALTVLLSIAIPGRPVKLSAQDLFGKAVAIRGDRIIVVKPGTSRGAAGITVFRRDADGAWQRESRLEPIDARPGEGLGGSIAAGGDLLLVAAADAETRWGAHVYRFTGSEWTPVSRIPLKPGPAATAAAAPDFAAMMRFAQPAERRVAITADGSLAAVAEVDAGRILVVRPSAAAADWSVEASIRPDSSRDITIAGLALSADRLIVGAAGANQPGRAWVYTRSPTGSWTQTSTLLPPFEPAADPGFGAALAFDGDAVLVGSPSANAVMLYRDLRPGDNTPAAVLRPGAADGSGFGAALAADGQSLWIGAPLADGGRGAVHRFRRNRPDAPWTIDAVEAASSLEPRSVLGNAVALGPGLAAVGAANARGGHGQVRVWSRDGAGRWSVAADFDAGDGLKAVAGEEVRCAGGQAGRFACSNVDLVAFMPIAEIGGEPGEHVSDLWGWTDPETRREYALVGRRGGVAIVDVTDAVNPRYLGVVPGNPSGPRDIKVYRDHMFFVGDGAGEHGLLVFDLRRLRSVRETPTRFVPDARYDGMASAHNLVMDTASATAIPVSSSAGGNTCGGGLHMVDVRDPIHPVFAGCYTDTEGLIWQGRTHDAQCVIYRGPDEKYRGRDVCFVANETALRLVDISDRSKPAPISVASYPDRGYVHQGWLTEDQRWFFMNDEADELVGLTPRTRTLIWDVADLDDPVLAGQYLGPDAATDHNLYIRGNLMYLANYQAGLRVVDISHPLHPVEVGFFDTTPWNGNPPGWVGGAWTAFPYLESGTVLVSSINEGLFLLRPRTRPVF